MDQKIEIERMEAAFKRAADKAVHGTREERAGRFEMRNDTRSMLPEKGFGQTAALKKNREVTAAPSDKIREWKFK